MILLATFAVFAVFALIIAAVSLGGILMSRMHARMADEGILPGEPDLVEPIGDRSPSRGNSRSMFRHHGLGSRRR